MSRIVFSPPMVRAILEGRKTMTRRVIDSLNNWDHDFEPEPYFIREWGFWAIEHPYGDGSIIRVTKTKPGDRLAVAETHYAFGHWEHVQKKGRMGWQFFCDRPDDIRFDPPNCALPSMDKADPGIPTWYKRNARFMPSSYARLHLEVVAVGVERLTDISEADAMAEGLEFQEGWLPQFRGSSELPWRSEFPRDAFADLWNSLRQPPQDWASNPWVAVVKFWGFEA